VYTIGFLANAVVPKSVDAGVTHSFGDPLVMNLVLIGVFGLQHSLMARPWFKERWTRFVPKPVERSTYVLFATLALVALLWGWRPLIDVVWQVDGVPALVLWAVYLGGWGLLFAAVFMIDMADLFGLRQVNEYLHGRELEPLDFQIPLLYRFMRHPIMTGFLIVFWVTPQMTVGRLLFAAGMTVYILVGVTLEQRDLVAAFGDRYRQYQSAVPMFVPRPWRTFSMPADDADADAD
jgi:protein-S-isoprenylcysteine O-methyltransferase Ste14